MKLLCCALLTVWAVMCGARTPLHETPVRQQLAELQKVLATLRVGMITNPTSVTEDLAFIPDLLARDKTLPYNISCFFAPEHGLRGDKQDGVKIDDYVDDLTGLTVYSLYGKTRAPTEEQLRGLDAILYDIQDVGARFYTFMWTMTFAMEAAAKYGKKFVVLDRPNPIGADIVEGPPNTMDAGSIGRKWPNAPFGVPTRFGMTIGEVAKLVNAEWMDPKVDLHVVPIPGYRRSDTWESLGRPWVMPSPNMPTCDGTAAVYTGTCVFEDVNGASEGRGTTRPFEIIGLPGASSAKAASAFAAALNNRNLPGVLFRTTFFTTTFGKYVGQPCGGVQVHVTNFKKFKPVVTGLEMLQTMAKMFPGNVTIYQSISKKTGVENMQSKIMTMSVAQIEQGWQSDLAKYMVMRSKHLLYH